MEIAGSCAKNVPTGQLTWTLEGQRKRGHPQTTRTKMILEEMKRQDVLEEPRWGALNHYGIVGFNHVIETELKLQCH